MRANPFVRNFAIIQLLDPARFDEFIRLNDLRTAANRAEDEAKLLQIRLAGKKRAGAGAEEVQAVEVKIAELEKAAEEGFKAAGEAVNIQQLLDGYEVIPEGTVMTNRIRLIEGADTEMELLLLALDPFCEAPQILEPDNFLANLDPARPDNAHFICVGCGRALEESDRPRLLSTFRWKPHNPSAAKEHRSFWIWSAYSYLQTWPQIAREWLRSRGDPI